MTSAAEPRVIPRRAVISWILYDLANVIFSMGVISMQFPLFVAEKVGAARADSIYAIISGIAMGIMFLLSPLLGALTDRARRRMPFLFWATVLACTSTALLGRGPFLISALLFIFANAGYQAGVQFYDSLLPEVTTDSNRGRIAGLAVGLGYLGSYIAVGIALIITPKGGTVPYPLYFLLVAIAFFTIATPAFLFIKEKGNPSPRPIWGWKVVKESVTQTIHTLKSGNKYPGLLRFLLGRAFYTDAINTVIAFMTLYTVNLSISTGLPAAEGKKLAQFVLLCAITAAIFGGVIWGRVVDKLGPKRTLDIVLYVWMATFVLAACVGFLGLPVGFLFVVACAAGVSIGGTWASDKTLMLRLTPPDRVGEFYGLYGMVGRFSAVLGPSLWGVITYIVVVRMGKPEVIGEALAIMMLLGMTIIAFRILRPVSDEKRDWVALGHLKES
jgi:UMF1 family MFS transporter